MFFQFKIQLKYLTKPTVWRRVLVPAQFSFDKFHDVIQRAFGWENDHLYQFSPKGWGSTPAISRPTPNPFMDFGNQEDVDSTKIKLKDVFTKEKQKYTYIYDFGDDWTHEILLEKISEENATRASCTDGGGACPPEDCGGFPGYMQLMETLSNPKDPEHEDMKEWMGLEEDEKWDPSAFNLEAANKAVSKVR